QDATLPRSPYVGVQFVAIPEFQSIGTAEGLQLTQLLHGKTTVPAALERAQRMVEGKMREAGYHKTQAEPAPAADKGTGQGKRRQSSTARNANKATKGAKAPARPQHKGRAHSKPPVTRPSRCPGAARPHPPRP